MGQDIQLFVSMITRAVVQGYTLRQREVWPRPPSALSARGSPPAGPARRAPLSLVWPPARRVGQYPQANRQGPGDNCTGCDHLAHPALAHWPRTRLLLHPAVLPRLLPVPGTCFDARVPSSLPLPSGSTAAHACAHRPVHRGAPEYHVDVLLSHRADDVRHSSARYHGRVSGNSCRGGRAATCGRAARGPHEPSGRRWQS